MTVTIDIFLFVSPQFAKSRLQINLPAPLLPCSPAPLLCILSNLKGLRAQLSYHLSGIPICASRLNLASLVNLENRDSLEGY